MHLPPHFFVWLASQSPRRSELLHQIGIAHKRLLADDHEDTEAIEAVHANEKAPDYVQRVTHAKADAAFIRWQKKQLPPAPIVCADTCVALNSTILGKPKDAQDATRMLQQLSGSQHQVLTAVVVLEPTSQQRHTCMSISNVWFEALNSRTIAHYIASNEPFGKAGAYAIQGIGATLVRHIEGSYSGIMGLPVFETNQLLQQIGTINKP